MKSKQIIIIVGVIKLLLSADFALAGCDYDLSAKGSHREVIKTSLGGIGAITAWGVYKWDYFDRSTHSVNEGWFGQDTNSGGADKLGHFYTAYIVTHGISKYYENHCITKDKSVVYGALTSFTVLSYMEFGDAFSDYGFSKEDFLANLVGAAYGYYSYTHPSLANKLDFRWEYGLNPQSSDLFTDYENSKYLFALKLNGFSEVKDTFLKHLELHLGYYTRGYDDPLHENTRNLYIGLGFNLSDYFYRREHQKTATFLRYYQPPGLYVAHNKELAQ